MDKESIDAGEALCEQYLGRRPRKGQAAVSGDLYDLSLGHVFGQIWNRPGLTLQQRSLVTLAILATTGRDEELRIHIHGALNIGIERESIRELMIHAAHYAGWPAGVAGTRVAEAVFAALDERESSA